MLILDALTDTNAMMTLNERRIFAADTVTDVADMIHLIDAIRADTSR
jgi:hypothetical protein